MSEHTDVAPASIYGPVDRLGHRLRPRRPARTTRDAPEIWDELREAGCPVAHTDRYGGMWVPLTARARRARSPTTPSTSPAARVVVGRRRPIDAQAPIGAAPPITSDPPFHQLARRLLLPAFAPQADRAVGARDPAAVPAAPRRHRRHHAGRDRRRRRRRSTPQHIPVQRHRPHARLPGRGRRPVPRVRPRHARGRQPRARGARRELPASSTPTSTPRSRTTATNPRDDLTSYLLDVELDGQKLVARARPRHDRAAAHRRHRHDVERHRLVALAPRPTPRRPPAPRRRARAAADRHRGAAAGLRPGDDGPDGRQGRRLPRLPDEDGRLGAAAVPGRQPRPGAVRARRRGRHRPPREPPRRVRARHPPLPRLEPGPAGAARRGRGVPRSASRTSSSPTRTPCAGASARSAAPASCRSASSEPSAPAPIRTILLPLAGRLSPCWVAPRQATAC